MHCVCCLTLIVYAIEMMIKMTLESATIGVSQPQVLSKSGTFPHVTFSPQIIPVAPTMFPYVLRYVVVQHGSHFIAFKNKCSPIPKPIKIQINENEKSVACTGTEGTYPLLSLTVI